MRSSTFSRILPLLAATALLTACDVGGGGSSSGGGQALTSAEFTTVEETTEAEETDESETTEPSSSESSSSSEKTTSRGSHTPVNPADYERAGMSIFTYNIDGVQGDCAISPHGATCQGGTPTDAPMVTARPLPPRQADSIYIGRDGMHWTIFEGVGPSQGKLNPGQSISVGNAKCWYPDDDTLQCSSGHDSFKITAPDGKISISGTLVDTPVWDLPDYW